MKQYSTPVPDVKLKYLFIRDKLLDCNRVNFDAGVLIQNVVKKSIGPIEIKFVDFTSHPVKVE